MTENRKHGWAFWTASTLIMLALYVASWGPACWIVNRNPPALVHFGIVYVPLLKAAWAIPDHGVAIRALFAWGEYAGPDTKSMAFGMILSTSPYPYDGTIEVLAER